MLLLILSGIFAIAAVVVPLYLYFVNFAGEKKIEDQASAAKGELEKITAEKEALGKELEQEKKAGVALDVQLRQELAKLQTDLLQRDNQSLSSQLQVKSRELESTANSSAALTIQMQEKYERAVSLENSLKQAELKNASLSEQVEIQKKEGERLSGIIADLSAKSKAQEGVPQEEPEQLKQLLEAKEAVLRKLEQSEETARRESAELKAQLEAQKVPLPQPVVSTSGVSLEEYNKLKEKLESAEKVLRLLHGAG
jgi:hypothetical protein